MTYPDDQGTLVAPDVAGLPRQAPGPSRACKFCGQDLSADRLPTAAMRVFGRGRARREVDRCHARGMCFDCGMSP